MTLGLRGIADAVVSHAEATGRYDRVQAHEPRNAPGKGISASVTVVDVRPAKGRSGLNSTAVRVELAVRVLIPMARQPEDDIDSDLMDAVDALMAALSADFTLGGLVADVDLLGAYGAPLGVTFGYIDHDTATYRVADIVLPAVVNDLWDQAP